MRGIGDAQLFSNISATTAAFALSGGLFQLTVVATFGGGSVTLQMLGPDQVTWLNALTAVSANGGVQGYLPPGQYRVSIVTATAVYASVNRTPTGD